MILSILIIDKSEGLNVIKSLENTVLDYGLLKPMFGQILQIFYDTLTDKDEDRDEYCIGVADNFKGAINDWIKERVENKKQNKKMDAIDTKFSIARDGMIVVNDTTKYDAKAFIKNFIMV